jgi:hypothetical protein
VEKSSEVQINFMPQSKSQQEFELPDQAARLQPIGMAEAYQTRRRQAQVAQNVRTMKTRS